VPAPLWRESAGDPGKIWIDFQSDVTARDLAVAARENYASVEHLKRYTTTGMATDQGRTSNVNALAILARETGRDIGNIGVTTFRPPFVGLKMNAVAGISRGPLHAPIRRTPLHDEHLRLGADMADFGPWRRPDHYSRNGPNRDKSVAVEMAAVREGVGLFDASPLGKVEVAGPDAAVFLDRFYISDLLTLKPGGIRYSLILREDGVVFDDGVIVRLSPNHFLASPTSAHADQVAALFERWRQTEWPGLQVAVAPVSSNWATLAIAGPRARELLSRLEPSMAIDPQSFRHMTLRQGSILGTACRIARVSFTGELQFEISVRARFAAALWRHLLDAGQDIGIRAVGMEAWLRLRLEKGFIHIGTDTDGRTTPDDIGFGAMAARKSGDFLGKRSLSLPYMASVGREQLVGLRTSGPARLEVGGRIFAPGHAMPPAPTEGRVTSACFSPSVDDWIGLALLENGRARRGEKVTIHQSGRQIEATVVAPVFYDPSGSRMQA
jgi:sarcosine oxidase subunit alpha